MTTAWPKFQLGDCLTLKSGGTPSKARTDFWEGTIPWVSCKDMKVDFLHDAQDHLTHLGTENGTRLVPENTILFVVRGMILAREFPVALTKRTVAFNQDLKAAFPADFIHTEFLFHWFRANAYEILGRVDEAGHGTSRIQTDRLLSLPIGVPPLPTQQRIAGILSAYDELIENSQRRIKVLETMARALYREWFVHFRFPDSENHPRVASALGEIPEGWEVKTVEEIVKRVPVGKKYDQKTVAATGTVPVFDQGKTGIIGYHDEEPGVLIAEASPVIVFANHTCYQRLIHFPFSAIQNVLPFVSSEAIPRNIYWLHWATNGLVVFNDYKGHWPEFAAKEVVVPTADLCNRFGKFTAPLSRQILRFERQIQNLRRTRDLLLPRLLSGQINVEATN